MGVRLQQWTQRLPKQQYGALTILRADGMALSGTTIYLLFNLPSWTMWLSAKVFDVWSFVELLWVLVNSCIQKATEWFYRISFILIATRINFGRALWWVLSSEIGFAPRQVPLLHSSPSLTVFTKSQRSVCFNLTRLEYTHVDSARW